MNTILTDDALIDAIRKAGLRVIGPHKILARAVEAAVLAKLAQQSEKRCQHGAWIDCGICDKPRAHPAPQQVDRQRVPDEPDWRHPKIQALIGADARNRICIDLVWRILEDPRREFTASDMEYWDTLHDKVQEVALAAAPEAPAQAEQGRSDAVKAVRDAVLDYLDELKDDAIAHIWPEDLQKCQTSECVVEVASVRMGSPKGRTVPLFSLVQVREAFTAAIAAAPEAPAQASAVDERAAFEAWVDNYPIRPSGWTNACWNAWQARAALAQKGGAA